MKRFDLTREAWLPCLATDGRRALLGLHDVLVHAHDLRELAGESPAETAALHRMLIAFAHRVTGDPCTLRDWEGAWQVKRFEKARVADYLGRWRGRLQLFDDARPFYQSPAAVTLAAGGPRKAPVRRLVFETCDFGAASNLFAQRGGALDFLDAERAACALVAFQAFAQGGLTMGGSDAAAPLVLPGVVLATGANLFETLMLNVIPGASTPSDRPAWEADEPPVPGLTREALGPLDVLTWQSRALGLHPFGSDDDIDGFAYTPGERMENPARDPMGAWKERKGVWYPVGIAPERVVWRDAHALLQNSDATSRPKVCDHLAAVAKTLGAERPFGLSVLGMRWDQKRILVARHERLPVTAGLLADPARLSVVTEAVARAEAVDGCLRAAVWAWASESLGSADKPTIAAAADGARAHARYWAALSGPFEKLLLETEWGAQGAAVFGRLAERAAREALGEAWRARSGAAGRSLRAAAIAERVLRSRMAARKTTRDDTPTETAS